MVNNLLILSLIVNLLLIGAFIYTQINPLSYSGLQSSSDEEYYDCQGLNLSETAICVREYISTIYNYTVRNDTYKTLSDIKKNGEDCWGYSTLYQQIFSELGYNSKIVNIPKNGSASHQFTILLNNDGYVIMDGLHKYDAFIYKQ